MKVLLLIAALLASGAANAQAMFAPFMASSSAVAAGPSAASFASASFATQLRPTGPLVLNRRSWLAPMVSLYDRGDGYFVDGANDIPAINWALQGSYNGTTEAVKVSPTAYGEAGLFPGVGIQSNFAEPGIGITVPVGNNSTNQPSSGLAINTASNLGAQGVGAGYTAILSFIRQPGSVTADFEMYAGRSWISAGEGWQSSSGPGIMWGFAENFNNSPPGAGNLHMGAYVTTGTAGSPTQQTVGTYTVTAGVYYEFALTCINVSSGSANCAFYVNGIPEGTLNGVALPTTLSSGETDIMIGASYHTGTSESNHTPQASFGKLDFYPWGMSGVQVYYHSQHPWTMYQAR